MAKLYSVIISEEQVGGQILVDLVGVFSTKEKAGIELENIFYQVCDIYGITSLSKLSSYTEDSHFYINDKETAKVDIYCYIQETELDIANKIY